MPSKLDCCTHDDHPPSPVDESPESSSFWIFSSLNWDSICCVNSWHSTKRNAEMSLYCCAPCKPRYRRLIDSIYPRVQTDGLISANMQKLTFYAQSHPEKLERIGEYLVLRLSRDLNRQRFVQVKIAVEAMDQLLQSCHSSPSLPQFSASHLKMVQCLLESRVSQMEQLGTDSFVGFSNIEENSPSYHRQYDFFIHKFSQMCHGAYDEDSKCIRIAGLRGLRGVVWKSVTDDLQPNIWEQQHMDKIVPSILYNLQEPGENRSPILFEVNDETSGREESPRALSDRCLRELMGKASFGSLRAVMIPVLKHMDNHKQWTPPAEFAIHVFKAIIYSIQSQNSYFVIQQLIDHLDNMCSADANVRIGIATVLSNIVSIAGTSIGPLLLSIFNSLLKHLRTSVDFERSGKCRDRDAEVQYQEALINAMGDFANALPDYQKVEMMMFTVGNIPSLDDRSKQGDEFLQHVLVKTLLKVATKYRTAYLATVFTDSFLHTLEQLALVSDPQVRLGTQKIFHTLLDRHDNLAHLKHLSYVIDVSDVQLTVEKCSRADQMFMRKNISELTHMLYRAVLLIEENDFISKQIDALQCTMSLLCIEVGSDDTLIELFRLSLALQSLACDKEVDFNDEKRIAIHNMVAKYMNLASQLMANPSLCQHVQQVVSNRANSGPSGLNLLHGEQNRMNASNEEIDKELVSLDELDEHPEMLFDRNDLAEALKSTGKDVTRLSVAFANAASLMQNAGDDQVDGLVNSQQDNAGIDDVSMDLSMDWTPPVSRKQSRRNTIFSITKTNAAGLALTVSELKSIANTPMDLVEEEKKTREHTRSVLESIRRPFDERCAEAIAEVEAGGDLSRTIHRLMTRNSETVKIADIGRPPKPNNIFEIDFPSFAL